VQPHAELSGAHPSGLEPSVPRRRVLWLRCQAISTFTIDSVETRLERLSLVDLTNLAVEASDTPMHQGGLGVLDGRHLLDSSGHVRIERIRAHIEARLDRVPELRRKLWLTGPFEGRPLWVDDPTFRIEDHVLLAQLPAPGGERRAMEFANEKMAALMDRSRPLWQLEGYGPGEVGLFLKLHHVVADGMATLKIVALLFDLEPGVVESATKTWSPVSPPAYGVLVRDNIVRKRHLFAGAARRLAHPLLFLASAAVSCRGLWETLTAGSGAPHSSLNRPIGSTRDIAVLRLPLSDMKELAHARNVKVNDVILNLVAGGLRHVLIARGERVDGISIRASMAVLLSSSETSGPVGNHAGTMIVPLPVGEADSARRLAAIAAATARAKRMQRAVISQLFTVLLSVSGLTRFFIRRQHLVNVLVTNLAVLHFALFVAGARMRDAFAITPVAGNVTVSFAALSYNGNLDLSVHVEADAWPDLDILMRGMSSDWGEVSRVAA
jgi:diacylglycerol O-acyltransferase / wax synthase